jgi:trimethylamine--corrinoid protein Co-methyltransferase
MSSADPPGPPPSGYRLLTDAELDRIHDASLQILDRTGVRVLSAESRNLLADAGCTVHDGDLVRFPAEVVEEAVRQAPASIALHSRVGDEKLLLEGHRSYFGTGSDLPNTLDLDSGERRPSVLADVGRAARLVDALPNLDFAMSMAQASDVPQATSDRHSFLTMIENTSKPVVFTAWDDGGLADILAMAEVVAGGAEELTRSPFLIPYLEPTSPLQHTEEVLRKLLLMADKGLPFVYSPGPIDGASAPVTSAGALAMANAEVLSGLTLAQLRRPGAPVVYGSGSGPLNMRTGVATYFGPEFLRHCMAVAELAHYRYHLPVWGFSGCSDSKMPDTQAAAESAIWTLWTALSGANLVHDVGYLESGLTCSLEMIPLCDEIIGCVRRILEPFVVSATTLALDTIHEVGPGGSFLATAHTRSHFRECWTPRIFDQQTHEAWAAEGLPSAIDRAREAAREAIASHTPRPLEPGMQAELRDIIRAAEGSASG